MPKDIPKWVGSVKSGRTDLAENHESILRGEDPETITVDAHTWAQLEALLENNRSTYRLLATVLGKSKDPVAKSQVREATRLRATFDDALSLMREARTDVL